MTAGKDNTPAVDVLDGMGRDLEQGLFPLKAFADRGIYDLELRRIFARSWVFVGFESEIPNPGDYATRNIGEDPFIFVRGEDGNIRVLFNSCRHRAGQVCRDDRGNASQFLCPIHGWSYKTTGELDGVPAKSQGYRELDLSQWGLYAAPHVANYNGLVFANLDRDAMPFEQYLGNYRWYFDIQLMLSEGGMEVLGEPQRWVVNCNWKSGAENFTGDSSHTPSTHRSAIVAGVVRQEMNTGPGRKFRLHVNDCDGHAISVRHLEPGKTAFWDYPAELHPHFERSRLSPPQLELARRAINHNGTVFPNFSFLHFSATDSLNRPPAGFLSMRVWQPKGPDKTEIWNWILCPKEASAEYKERAFRAAMSSFGPSGNFEQDDVTVWPWIARSSSTVFAEMNDIKLNYQMGLGGMGEAKPIPDWPGPGVAVASSAGEGGLRTFHETWYERMTGRKVSSGGHGANRHRE